MVKNLPAMQETQDGSPGESGKIPSRKEWLPTPVFLSEEFHGQRSLAGYSPWGHKELDTTEGLTHTHNIHTALILSKCFLYKTQIGSRSV